MEWFRANQIQNIDTIVHIVGAYSESDIRQKLPKNFFDVVQLYVLQSSERLNYMQAIDLVSIMYQYATTELMEVFDRLIGQQHNNLSINEAFDALMAFCNAKQAKIRPKIIQVLFKRISKDFEKLSSSQLVLLVDMVARDSDKDLLVKLELNKFLQHRLPSLTITELVNVYISLGYQNDISLHKAAEEIIMFNIHLFRLDSLADLLYH
jgi:hypothetical protein